VDETDMSPWRVEVRLHFAGWLADEGSDEAQQFARQALEIAEAKEATTLAERARGLLVERDGV
jgi:hypothetical protein